MTSEAEFDRYADEYDAALAQGLSVSGEDKNYFAQGRIAFLASCLPQAQNHGEEPPRSVLDFGCGTGSATPFFFALLPIKSLLGVDVSARSLAVARRAFGGARAQFLLPGELPRSLAVDLAFCNGVFHHIPLGERAAAVETVYQALRPAGLFAFWENNPWNPGTRYVMDRCPFDGDAVTLTPPEARGLLRAGGFQVLRTDFLFLFPRRLCRLRPLEARVSRLPLGAQYQVLCRKPGEALTHSSSPGILAAQ